MRALVNALAPLDDQTRTRVLDYVARRYSIAFGDHRPSAPPASPTARPETPSGITRVGAPDINEFTRQKAPKSGIEMVTVLAYFLGHEVPANERRAEISSEDLTTYFPQADFPLPAKPRQCLVDAKNKGWLQPGSVAGSYKLTPVGQNLVRHKLPRAAT